MTLTLTHWHINNQAIKLQRSDAQDDDASIDVDIDSVTRNMSSLTASGQTVSSFISLISELIDCNVFRLQMEWIERRIFSAAKEVEEVTTQVLRVYPEVRFVFLPVNFDSNRHLH